jgi:hypothetical protein
MAIIASPVRLNLGMVEPHAKSRIDGLSECRNSPPTYLRIFLSSTFIDLRELRHQIANRLREVFGARLLTVETSGSDEAPPEISSVRRVRECDVFVGVCARRTEWPPLL